jgi:type II secretory pathway pseudopilin PulG
VNGAFTIVELVVTIGVVMLILGMLLPALARARGSAEYIRSLSNVRQLGQVIDLYTDHARGLYPATQDGRLYPTTGPPPGNPQASLGYWQVYETWSGVVFDILPYHEAVEVYVSPASLRFEESGLFPPWPSSYHYSLSFAGQPQLWREGAAADLSLRRSVQQHQVRFPSSKVLLWDAELAWEREVRHDPDTGDLITRSPTAFADGSASGRVHTEASDPVANPFAQGLHLRRLHNTAEGVHGRDY